jgi:hypothetical protein
MCPKILFWIHIQFVMLHFVKKVKISVGPMPPLHTLCTCTVQHSSYPATIEHKQNLVFRVDFFTTEALVDTYI